MGRGIGFAFKMIYSRQVFEAHPPTCLIAEQVKSLMLIIDLQEKTDSKNEKLTLKFQHEKEEPKRQQILQKPT